MRRHASRLGCWPIGRTSEKRRIGKGRRWRRARERWPRHIRRLSTVTRSDHGAERSDGSVAAERRVEIGLVYLELAFEALALLDCSILGRPKRQHFGGIIRFIGH